MEFSPFYWDRIDTATERRIDEAISNSSGPPTETRETRIPGERGCHGWARWGRGWFLFARCCARRDRWEISIGVVRVRSYSGRSLRNFVIIHTMLECMLAILKGPESIGRYEGMDLDLKGGRTRWQGRLGGLEVGRAISEPSVAQWLTGAIQPT